MTVRLRDSHIDRKIGAARETDAVIERDAALPIGLGQAIDADFSAETAAIE